MGRIVVRPAGYTGFLQQLTWTQGNNIPVTAHLWGGAGGGGGSEGSTPGGSGSGSGYTQTQFTINEGDILEVAVGGPGTGAASGGFAPGGTAGSSYLVDDVILFNTVNTIDASVSQQFDSNYCTFLNSYGVWINPKSARTFDRTYSVTFPEEAWYQFTVSANNTADIYLDGVLLMVATGPAGVGTNGFFLTAGTKQVRILATNTGGSGAVALTIGSSINFGGSFGGRSGPIGSSGAGGGGGGATVVILNGTVLGAAGGGGGGGGADANNGGQNSPGIRGQAPVGTNEGQNGTNKNGDGGGGGGGGGGWGGGNGGDVPSGALGGFAGVNGRSSGAGQNPSGRFPGGLGNEYYRSGIAVGGTAGGAGSAGYAALEFDIPGTFVNTIVNGVLSFRAVTNTYVNINGTWTEVDTPYIKQDGTWFPVNGYAPIFQNVPGRFGANPRAGVVDQPFIPVPVFTDVVSGWCDFGIGWVVSLANPTGGEL
jgi:hypothetical protein